MEISVLLVFAFLIFMSIPIGFALAATALVFSLFFMRLSPTVVPHEMFKALDSFPFMAIPLFILAGDLMNTSRITHQLIQFSNSIVGHLRGGLANVNILVSMLFSGLNGSAVADTVSIGAVLIPAMKEEGYDADFSAAITATSSIIGAIVPPSIAMVIYGTALGVSVGGLFAAGLIPGLMIGFMLMIMTNIISRRRNYPVHPEGFSFYRFCKELYKSLLALIMPMIIIGGIILGVFTPTEAAGIAVGYAAFLGFFVYRKLSLSRFIECLFRSGVTAGIILLLVGASAPFGWLINTLGVPMTITSLITEITANKYLVLFFFNIFLLFMGMIMDATANILILGPILAPVAVALGVDPIHFALVMIVNLIIGLGTPPVGISPMGRKFSGTKDGLLPR